MLEGEIHVGQGLRLDALSRVDDQQRAFAGSQSARHFVREIDVAGRVDQVELIVLAIGRPIVHADGLGLDGDALLALEIHGVEHLGHHVALGERTRTFEEPIGERRLAMIDMTAASRSTSGPLSTKMRVFTSRATRSERKAASSRRRAFKASW